MARKSKKAKTRQQRELKRLHEFLASSQRAKEAQRKSIDERFQTVGRNKHGIPVIVEKG